MPRRAHPEDALDPLHHSSAAAAAAHRRSQKPGQRRPRTAWIPAAPGTEGYEDEAEHYYDDADQSDSAAAAAARARVSGSRDASGDESDGVADWGLPNGRLPGSMGYGGVKAWLEGLGLSRYAPVFEIHEVDDEVLPLLTLEDLKDMGIGAVGSRRKLYAAIQKLHRSDGVS
uniref:SAM domain-containing protein n=1 Tax=Oryza brachyantha TaxID=4533 RepID=J3LUS3_ORYBR